MSLKFFKQRVGDKNYNLLFLKNQMRNISKINKYTFMLDN